MNAVIAGIGWGLAGGFLSTAIVLYVALSALWRRTQQHQPDPPAGEGRKDVTDFTGFGRRANG